MDILNVSFGHIKRKTLKTLADFQIGSFWKKIDSFKNTHIGNASNYLVILEWAHSKSP